MKKRKLKNLILHRQKISNLSIVNVRFGVLYTDYDTDMETNQGVISLQIACPTQFGETCIQTVCDTDCGTNGGTIQAPPPTEYLSCICNHPGF